MTTAWRRFKGSRFKVQGKRFQTFKPFNRFAPFKPFGG
jgi:hypothetical protein